MNIPRKEVVAILQARMSSSRLPGKVMSQINGLPMIGWQIQRIREAKSINQLVVATSEDRTDDVLVSYLESVDVDVYRGSLDDVYSRFVGVLQIHQCDVFLRLTGDCPFVMPEIIDKMVEYFLLSRVDYLSNTLPPTYPDGLDIEVVSTPAFLKLSEFKLSDQEREHVTMALYRRSSVFSLANFENGENLSAERWTVDYAEDMKFAMEVFRGFRGRETSFGLEDLLGFLSEHPEIHNEISGEMRNFALGELVERKTENVE